MKKTSKTDPAGQTKKPSIEPKSSIEDISQKIHLKGAKPFSAHALFMFVIVFAVIGGYVLWRSFAAAAPIGILEAETMTLPPGASVVSDSSASGGRAVQMTQDGSLTSSITLPSKATAINLVAKSTHCASGWPTLTLTVDSQVLLSQTVQSTDWLTIPITAKVAAGNRAVSLRYSWSGKKCTPILSIDNTTFFGKASAQTPTVSLSASPSSIRSGQSTTLQWTSTNASSCSASALPADTSWSGNKATSGSQTVTPSQSTSYSLACTGAGGTTTAGTQITVTNSTVGVSWIPASGSSCTIYVDSQGNPSSNGSLPDQPTTFLNAHNLTVPGSVVCVNPGAYNFSSIVSFDTAHSGSSSAWVTYKKNGSGTVNLNYTGAVNGGGLLQLSGCTPWCGGHNFIFDGFTIDGANLIGAGIKASQGAHHLVVRNTVVRNTGAAGLSFNGSDYTAAENNQIYHFGYDPTHSWSSGINLWYGGRTGSGFGGAGGSSSTPAWFDSFDGYHNVYVNNLVAGGDDTSSHCSDGNGFIVDGSPLSSIPPVLFMNNVVYQNGGRGAQNLANDANAWFVNNTFYANGLDKHIEGGSTPCANGKARELEADTSSNNHWLNNIAFARTNGANYSDGYTYNSLNSSTISIGKNLSWNGTITNLSVASFIQATPLFTNAPTVATSGSCCQATPPWQLGSDLSLVSGSQAIDTGVDPRQDPAMKNNFKIFLDYYLQTDASGQARIEGSAIDLGAYEH